MDCVVCQKPLIAVEFEGVEVDRCFSCGGLWLDKGELELLLGNKEANRDFLNSFKTAENVKENKRPCPICRKSMEKVSWHGLNKKVLLDKCPERHGLWFDRGELGEVLEAAHVEDRGRVVGFLKCMFVHEKH